MLYICNSFDYELFMGKNCADEKEVLIKPTWKLASMLTEENVPSTFFADVCCPMRYRQLGRNEFPDDFDSQLTALEKMGHDVQLHIHPQWIATSELGANVVFDRNTYRIHNWKTKDGSNEQIKTIIHEGAEYLRNLLLPVNPNYKCIAFRAGGYCIQPENEIADILFDEGIRIDSSMCCGFSHDGDGMYYDYTPYKRVCNLYINRNTSFSDMCSLPIEKGIFEIPVGGYSTFPYRAIASKKNRSISEEPPRGYGMKLKAGSDGKKNTLAGRIKRIITATNMLTFDCYHADTMVYMLERVAYEEKCSKRDVFVSTIAHPKGMTDEHIVNMKKAIQYLKHNKNIYFASIAEAAKIIGIEGGK